MSLEPALLQMCDEIDFCCIRACTSESVSREGQGEVSPGSWEENGTSFIVPKYFASRLSGKGKVIRRQVLVWNPPAQCQNVSEKPLRHLRG